jgi:hypothetical protein
MRLLFIALLFTIASTTNGQYLSESSTISLLTGSPGAELYSTFGHSGIRIKDPAQNIDIVFNYGTFNFNTPNFYLKFAQGKLLYKLSIERFEQFKYGFEYENRYVVEQVLNLTTTQKQRLYTLLMDNYKPENRYYKYDFFFDNCATRIRDIMPKAFGEDFEYHYTEEWLFEEMSFRNLIDLYLTNHHWSDFGIDLALGLPTDKIASPSDYMFLPDYLQEGFASATIVKQGKEVPLVLSTKEIISKVPTAPDTFLIKPMIVCWFIFIITLTVSFYGFKKNKRLSCFDAIYFSIIGLVGWMVFLLDFATDHIATKQNLNMLWAVPLHLPLFLVWKKLSWKLRQYYIWICLVIDVFIIGLWMIFPQNYHNAFIPLILAMITRYFMLLKFDKKPDALDNAIIA